MGETGKANVPVQKPMLTDKQFEQLRKTVVYAMAVFGTLSAGKQPSPTAANLAQLKAYADAVLEMVG